MAIIVIAPAKDFVGARAELKRQKAKKDLVEKSESARKAFQTRLTNLATQRLALLIPWWEKNFPKRRLQISDYNNMWFVFIDGRTLDVVMRPPTLTSRKNKYDHFKCPKIFDEIIEALKDVDTITNGGRDGCPDNLFVEKKTKELPHGS